MMDRSKSKYTSFCIVFLMCFLPLFVRSAYFDIIEAKFAAYSVSFLVLFLPAAFLTVLALIKRSGPGLCAADISVLCFAAVALVSCLASGRIRDSFFGSDGWYVGAFSILSAVFLYFFISRCAVYVHNVWLPIFAVNSVMLVIGMIQFAGVDLFGMHAGVLEKQYYQYFSTFGNTNWLAGYLCLMLPAAFVFFLTAGTKLSYAVDLIFLSLGAGAVLTAASDGAYLGIGFALFFAVPFIFRDIVRLRRAILVCAVSAAEALAVGTLPCFSGLIARSAGVSRAALDPRICAPVLAVCAVLLIVLRRSAGYGDRTRRVLIITGEAVLGLAAAVIAVQTALTFSDRWGSSRGMIWRVSFEKYYEFGLKDKLIGVGPDLLRGLYTEVQQAFKDLPVLSSHSEPVQILLTMGAAGLAAWLGTAVSAAVSFFRTVRRGSGDPAVFAFFLPLAAYFAQSLVNSATVVNVAALAIFAALYRVSIAKK